MLQAPSIASLLINTQKPIHIRLTTLADALPVIAEDHVTRCLRQDRTWAASARPVTFATQPFP